MSPFTGQSLQFSDKKLRVHIKFYSAHPTCSMMGKDSNKIAKIRLLDLAKKRAGVNDYPYVHSHPQVLVDSFFRHIFPKLYFSLSGVMGHRGSFVTLFH